MRDLHLISGRFGNLIGGSEGLVRRGGGPLGVFTRSFRVQHFAFEGEENQYNGEDGNNAADQRGLAHRFVPHGGIAAGLYFILATLLFSGALFYGVLTIQSLRDGDDDGAPALCFLTALVCILCGVFVGLPLVLEL